ncbi:hypothetical protein GGI04_003658 [Coemansia thaxteri]|nr:hypothetical protein GGI04_003658 [Coemansia thaxteri]
MLGRPSLRSHISCLLPLRVLWLACQRLPFAATSTSRHIHGNRGGWATLAPKKDRWSKAPVPGKPIKEAAATEVQEEKRSIWRKQFVLNNYDIPGKYQKFFTGRLRNREASRFKKQLDEQPSEDAGGKVPRVGSRAVILDEELQHKRVESMRSQVLRILERHLSTGQLPVRQLSMQYWEITDVLVSFNLKTVVCCYQVTAKHKEEQIKPYQIRKIIKESTKYLGMVVNQELGQSMGWGASRSIGGPRTVNLKFVSGAATAKLMDKMAADVHRQSEPGND